MKLATLATLTALVVGYASASPAEDVLTPSGIPGTASGTPPFSPPPPSSISFDTTATPSTVSGLSSLITSESTSIMPFTGTSIPTAASSTASASPSSTTVASSPTATSTGGARSLTVRAGDVRFAGVAAVLGAVAALVC